MERQEGEGSEIVEPEPCQKQSTSTSHASPLPLDQLLTSASDELAMKGNLVLSEDMLKENLTTAEKKIEHLTELLNDNEATVMRLTEQAKLLKEEIRRMERNQKREEETSNMEYLKNILLKYISLKVGEERQQLVPVLTTMLKLSPEEKGQLDAAALGEEVPTQGQGGSWGSYLPKWSGLV